MSEEKKINRLTGKKRVEVYEALKRVLTKHEDNKVSYVADYTPERIAMECGVTRDNVEAVRREMFGNLYYAPKAPKTEPTNRELLEQLMHEVLEMKAWIKDVQELLESLR